MIDLRVGWFPCTFVEVVALDENNVLTLPPLQVQGWTRGGWEKGDGEAAAAVWGGGGGGGVGGRDSVLRSSWGGPLRVGDGASS